MNSLDEDGVKLGVDFEMEGLVYLVDDASGFERDVEATVAPHLEFIFEEELNAWYRMESDWPARRDFDTPLDSLRVFGKLNPIQFMPPSLLVKTQLY